MYSSQVLFPKPDRIDRVIIALEQQQTTKTPVVQQPEEMVEEVARSSLSLTCTVFLFGEALVCPVRGSSPRKRHICLDLSNRCVSIEGFVPAASAFFRDNPPRPVLL